MNVSHVSGFRTTKARHLGGPSHLTRAEHHQRLIHEWGKLRLSNPRLADKRASKLLTYIKNNVTPDDWAARAHTDDRYAASSRVVHSNVHDEWRALFAARSEMTVGEFEQRRREMEKKLAAAGDMVRHYERRAEEHRTKRQQSLAHERAARKLAAARPKVAKPACSQARVTGARQSRRVVVKTKACAASSSDPDSSSDADSRLTLGAGVSR